MKKIAFTAVMATVLALTVAKPTLAANPLYKVSNKDVVLLGTPNPNGQWRCKIGKNSIVEWLSQNRNYFNVKLVHQTFGMVWPGYDCKGWVNKTYVTSHPSAPGGTWFITKDKTEIKSEPSRYGAGPWMPRGHHKCTIPKGEHVHRDNSNRKGEPDWIYVRWKKKWNHNFEWNYRGQWGPGLNNWCQDWNRHGWVWVGKLNPIGNNPRW